MCILTLVTMETEQQINFCWGWRVQINVEGGGEDATKYIFSTHLEDLRPVLILKL